MKKGLRHRIISLYYYESLNIGPDEKGINNNLRLILIFHSFPNLFGNANGEFIPRITQAL